MPLDVLGRTRATLTNSTSILVSLLRAIPWLRCLGNLLNVRRDGARLLQLLIFNEEFLVNASHQLALITSLPFVHTARRTYRLNGPVKTSDFRLFLATEICEEKSFKPYHLEEGEVVTRFP